MRIFARTLAFLAALALCAQQVSAQETSILRDAETEKLLQDMVDPLVVAAGMRKGAVDVVIVNDPSLNAFVAGGQRIYVHSGLINAASLQAASEQIRARGETVVHIGPAANATKKPMTRM